jgi:hypothetical protein
MSIPKDRASPCPAVRPRNRAQAVEWARQEARLIVDGEYDTGRLGVFNAAERIDHVLTQWTWNDDDFPPPVAAFVLGWHASGPETDAAIRHAARALVRDTSSNGPPLPRHSVD